MLQTKLTKCYCRVLKKQQWQWQWEWQKSNRFRLAKQKLCKVIAWTQCESAYFHVLWRFWPQDNNYLSFFELQYSSLEFSTWKIADKCFSSCCQHCCLSSLMSNLYRHNEVRVRGYSLLFSLKKLDIYRKGDKGYTLRKTEGSPVL